MEGQSLGEKLKKARKEKGFTLRELSEKSGVSHSYISQLENERNSNPTPLFLKRIADALSLPFATLASLVESTAAFDDKEIGYLRELEKEAEQAIETINMIWAGREENYKMVLEDLNEKPHSEIINILKNDRPVFYNKHKLTPGERQQVLNMLEVLFPQYKGDD